MGNSPKSESCDIPVGLLIIDEAYQRLLREETKYHVIEKDFNPVSFGVVIVSERDSGEYIVLDGWRRSQVAKGRYGEKWMCPCRVTKGLSPKEEAQVFIDINHNRLSIAAAQLYLSSLTAGNKVELEMESIARRYGYSFGVAPFRAVSCLRDVYQRGVLDETLIACREAWGVNFPVVGFTMKGIGIFLQKYQDHPKFNHARFVATLESVTPDSLQRKGRAIWAEHSAHGGHVGPGIAAALIDLYNRGSRRPLLPKWQWSENRI